MVEDIGRLLAEDAEAVKEHRDDDVPLVRSRRPAKEPAQVYSLRIPAENWKSSAGLPRSDTSLRRH